MKNRNKKKDETIAFVIDSKHSEIMTYIMSKPKKQTQEQTYQATTTTDSKPEQLENQMDI